MAGVPQGLSTRIKKENDDIRAETGWEIKLFTVNAKSASINIGEVPSLLDFASTLDTPHIIGFNVTDGQSKIAPMIREHFRFRWGNEMILKSLGSSPADYRQSMREIFDEEQAWRQHVLPNNKSSPLILPQFVFKRIAGYPDVWRLAETFNRNDEFYADLKKKLILFEKDHRKRHSSGPHYMVDDAGLVWKDRGPFHAKTPVHRRWKYSCQLPDSFHFDVEHHKGGAFKVIAVDGTKINKKQKEHTNIDSHGFHSHGKTN